MEALYRDYAPKGVKFYYIYKSLAHPELKGYINPFTLEERFMHVKEARRTLGTTVPWIVDRMDNQIKHALGDHSNLEFLLDPEGTVVHKLAWSDPETLRHKLEELLGPVDSPTPASDFNAEKTMPERSAAGGVLPRLERPLTGEGHMVPIRRKPILKEGDPPFYAKLRVEADPSLLKKGRGRLYLGFFMDPLYHVHWNNLTEPIHVRIETPEGVSVSASELVGPRVEVESDVDPREFMVDVISDGTREPLGVSAFYFACNDDEGWCTAMTQRYQVFLEFDRDGGNHPARSSFGHHSR